MLRQRQFAEAFITLRQKGVGDQSAARQAAVSVGYAPSNATQAAQKLLNQPVVRKHIDNAFAKHRERAQVNGETILRYWFDIATCELPFPPAGPCRHCWGQDHQYQFTLAEYRAALRKHTSDQMQKQPHQRRPFDDLGGTGFDKTLKPHPYCPECNGQGRNYILVVDRDKLTEAQRMAIDEVRVHKDGSVSLRMRDRSRAMENLQALMGLVQPRKPLEVIDPARPIEENVNILLQTAIDQGLLIMPQPSLPQSVIENEPEHTERLADADAA